MSIKKDFGKKIKEKRLEKGLTQEQLAEKIGISPKSLSQIELGNNFVSAENLELICLALNTTPKALFDFDSYTLDKEQYVEFIVNKIKDNNKLLDIIYKVLSVL